MNLMVVKRFIRNSVPQVEVVVFCIHGEWENMYVVSSPKYSNTSPSHPTLQPSISFTITTSHFPHKHYASFRNVSHKHLIKLQPTKSIIMSGRKSGVHPTPDATTGASHLVPPRSATKICLSTPYCLSVCLAP